MKVSDSEEEGMLWPPGGAGALHWETQDKLLKFRLLPMGSTPEGAGSGRLSEGALEQWHWVL